MGIESVLDQPPSDNVADAVSDFVDVLKGEGGLATVLANIERRLDAFKKAFEPNGEIYNPHKLDGPIDELRGIIEIFLDERFGPDILTAAEKVMEEFDELDEALEEDRHQYDVAAEHFREEAGRLP